MGLFEKIFDNATPAEREEIERYRADIEAHFGQRPCPEHCGCTEFFDDREPDEVTGGFGVAGCECPRCNGETQDSKDRSS